MIRILESKTTLLPLVYQIRVRHFAPDLVGRFAQDLVVRFISDLVGQYSPDYAAYCWWWFSMDKGKAKTSFYFHDKSIRNW